MAEETKVEEQATPVAPVTEENDKDGKNEKRGGRDNKKDETPIEELFDLTKPITRVERPSKENHEGELNAISETMDALKAERSVLQVKIDAAMDNGRGSEIGKVRDALGKLRSQKGALIDEKKAIRAKLDAIKNQGDKIQKDRKDAKSVVRFTKLEDIQAEIKKLQYRQETTSMKLQDEKRLIKEIDNLQASKALVADLNKKDASLESVKEQRKTISQQISAKDTEIDDVQKDIDIKSTEMKGMADKETGKRDALKGLFTKKDTLRKQMNEKMKERDVLRQVYHDANNSWYNYQRAARALKQIQYEEEKKQHEEERAEWLKKKEEEEAKKVPYEEEMALCDYLADYLTKTHLVDGEEQKRLKEEEAEKKRQASVIAVKEDPFAGFKANNKKDIQEEAYFTKGKKGKNKKSRATKTKATAGPFTLSVDSFEQFGLLSLTPPISADLVAKSVEELSAKKQWYSEQPRGSVPTASEIRKSSEKAAAKVRSSNVKNGEDSSTPAPKTKSKKQGGFDISGSDFTPLGSGAASSSINVAWGHKAPVPVEDAGTPAEAM